ncbi:MAG: 3-hydroxyacyl-CoA dehydrogenase family protein [Elusimicrobia bacterium]|nr:3-hydroxyacyl-CoA dehydrogenase family protein [Elusimicrobiota bacterium]
MGYPERLENVAVLGAAGKMGSGIVLLVSQEMADLSLKPENKSRVYVLHAVDLSHQALSGLMGYLREQVRKSAEKKIVALRLAYSDRADLVDNGEIVDAYIARVLDVVRPATVLESAAQAGVVFEAAPEDLGLKLRLLSKCGGQGPDGPWIFTNTSSIPIHEIDEKAKLGGRVMGFHFYNPPAVQKLVELIRGKTTLPEVAKFAEALAKSLRKTVVLSRDVAGFIGNGHFMRDMLHGIAEAERLAQREAPPGGQARSMPFTHAVYSVNKVSQDFLVRPMGIFQLVDYVGLDVCQCILNVMDPRLPGKDLKSALIDRLLGQGVKGGQRHDGSQKDGFLKYEGGKIAGVWDPEAKRYAPVAELQAECDKKLGPLPEPALPWKAAVKHPSKDKALAEFFGKLDAMTTLGAELAKRYGGRSKEIGLGLVSDGVAASAEDVNKVLLTGFFHAYGPVNEYFKAQETPAGQKVTR